jgi:hypothetical protein
MKKRILESNDKCNCPPDNCDCKPQCNCGPDCKCDCNPKEGLSFDKFMDSILISENIRQGPKTMPDSPQRIRAKRNQDRPANRTYVRELK